MSTGQKRGRWYCAWRDPAQNGKIVTEYFGFGVEAERAAKKRDLEIKMAKLAIGPRLAGDAPLFRELAQDYINARHVEIGDKTRDHILRTTTKYALPVIAGKPANRVTMADWTEVEKIMIARKVKARTINKYFQYLSKIFTWGMERYPEVIRDHPWNRRKPLRIKNKFKIELITPEEFQKIVSVADDHLRWALEVEYNTGVRPGATELFALKWTDFDYETGALKVFSPKTQAFNPIHIQYVSGAFLARLKERRALMRAEALRLAKRRGYIAPECPFVISFQGEPIRQLANSWKAAKKRAGIERRIRLMDIRHFYITYALARGADLLDLAHRVGHKDANMLVNFYAHLVDEMKSKSAFDLPDFDFTAKDVPDLLVQNVSTNNEGLPVEKANNIISITDFGRGGRI